MGLGELFESSRDGLVGYVIRQCDLLDGPSFVGELLPISSPFECLLAPCVLGHFGAVRLLPDPLDVFVACVRRHAGGGRYFGDVLVLAEQLCDRMSAFVASLATCDSRGQADGSQSLYVGCIVACFVGGFAAS